MFSGGRTKLILASDFNLPNIEWPTMRAMGSNVRHSELLMNITFLCDLTQIVETCTRICAISSHVLDLVFVNSAINCTNLVATSRLSYHKLVFATFSVFKYAGKQRAPITVKSFNRA